MLRLPRQLTPGLSISLLHRMATMIGILALLALSTGAQATAVKQTPWEPDVAAYRTALFLANMSPVPWGTIEQAWYEPINNTTAEIRGYDALAERPDGTAMVDALKRAIATQDTQILFEVSTNLMAKALLQELDLTANGLDDGTAPAALLRGAALYRAFDDGVRLLDKDGYRATGLA